MKNTVVMLIMIFATVFAFAEGSRERGRGPDGSEKPGILQDEAGFEEVTLTGTLDLSQSWPVLIADGTSYRVMVPRRLPDGFNAENGQTVTLTGYVHDAPAWRGNRFGDVESDKVIAVTKAVIDGQEYVIERGMRDGGFGCYSLNGRRRPMNRR